jgi:glutamyl-tRNA synthetase
MGPMTTLRGRFAPSPTGALHAGNLRTALVAWLQARSSGGEFVLRFEDLDRLTSSPQWEQHQAGDLAALGLDWDGPPQRHSDRFDLYDAAERRLRDLDVLYPCFCTRREIAEAASAPHGPMGRYPGTCRHLDTAGRQRLAAGGRPPAWRLRAGDAEVTVRDRLHGEVTGVADDIVVRRNDGVPAYNLAVVVDDAEQDISDVVRGDDLLTITPSQAHLGDLLGYVRRTYLHVPLVVGADGQRLAKRHGAITRDQLAGRGCSDVRLRDLLAASLGLIGDGEHAELAELVDRFDVARLTTSPWVFDISTVTDLSGSA